jgi:predicted transcriptional regulator
MESSDLIALTADIVSSHVSHNMVSNADLPVLIASVHAALVKTAAPAEREVPAGPVAATTARKR